MALIFGNSLANNGEINTTGIVADDHEIILRTNGLDRIYINNDGNMSIGQQQSDFDNSDKLLIYDESSAVIRFKNSTTSSGTRIGLETNDGGFIINNLEDKEIKFLTNGQNRLIITNEGNVNIGDTTSENAQLFVCKNTATAESTVLVQQNGTGDSVIGFSLSGGQQWSMGIDNSDSDKFKINNESTVSTVSEFVIDNSGNVGIGSNSPTEKLDVSGNIKAVGLEVDSLEINGNINAEELILNRGTHTSSYTNILTIEGSRSANSANYTQINFDNLDDDSANLNYTGAQISSRNDTGVDTGDLEFHTYNGTLNEVMVLDSNGDVGIGTNNPTQKLDVNGDVLVRGGDLYLTDTNERIGSNGFEITFDVGGTERMKIDSVGNLTINSGIINLIDGDDRIRSDGSEISIDVGGVQRMKINASGNVGIGTITPTQKLDVNGNGLFSGDIISVGGYGIGNSGYNMRKNGSTIEFQVNTATSLVLGLNEATFTKDLIITEGRISLFDTNEYINSDGIDMTFGVGGTQRMVIDENGNVGIGINNPIANLHVYENDNSTIQLRLEQDGAGDCGLNFKLTGIEDWTLGIDSSDSNKFKIQNATNLTIAELTIDTSGNVGIGTNNPSQKLEITGDILVQGGDLYLVDTNEKISSDGVDMTFNVGGSEVVKFENGGSVGIGVTTITTKMDVGGDMKLTRTTFTSGLTRTLTIEGARSASGNNYAKIDFSNLDDNNDVVKYTGARIGSHNQDGTNKGNMRFSTHDGTNITLRMLITAEGEVLIGTETADEELTLIGEAGKTVGGTVWNDNSDVRIKENIVDRDTAESLICLNALRLREFDFTDEYMEYSKNTQKHRIGFIAQEVELVHPESIITAKNPIVIGNTTINDFKKINMSQLNYELIGAIQELSRRLSILENN